MIQRSVVARVLTAKGIRAFGDGFVSLLLPLYLLDLGFSPLQVGIIATATLFGSGLLTLAAGLHAHRWNYRTLLLAAAVLMTATGLGFAFAFDFWPLFVVAIVGTLNPSSGDVSVFLPLEHAVLSRIAANRDRTRVFARYSLVGAVAAAVGSLATALPGTVAGITGMSPRASLQVMFVLYAALGLLVALTYRGLPRIAVAESSATVTPLRESRRRVLVLATLFSLDAFGGGFVVQSMLALWLYQRFGMSLELAGMIFFWTGLFTAVSYLVAVRIAARIGLVNTMVFTHLPSSVCLILIPFMPAVGYVIALLFVRSALSQMDVPTRSSYVMAIVPAAERPAAASVTVGSAQPGLGGQPVPRGLSAVRLDLRMAAHRRGGLEDPVRPAPACLLPERAPARGATR